MIPVTRPDGSTLLINPDRIETVEDTPDTVITMADGKKLLVRESASEIADRFSAYQKAIRTPNSRFGGRRESDPPEAMDPSLYQHPGRGTVTNLRIAHASDEDARP
ncbi:MAG: flagellar FlbD family protein [Chloroflexota bacterium]